MNSMLLRCDECGYEERGPDSRTLMMKIKIWNHLKKAHPSRAERILSRHDTLPNTFYTQVHFGDRPASRAADYATPRAPRFSS